MKNIRSIIFLFTLVFALGALAQQPQAQDDKQSDQAHAKHGNMPNSEALLKHLTEALNLTDNQQTAVKAIRGYGSVGVAMFKRPGFDLFAVQR